MTCPFCKEDIRDGAIKCKHCGSTLSPDTYVNNIVNLTTDEIRAFAGTNAYYYIQAFARFTATGCEKYSVTWNWSCFGFTFVWMLYRKMYAAALITFLVFCIPGVNILLHLGAGMVGNYLYYRHTTAKILEARATHPPHNLVPILQEMGGVNRWVVWATLLLSILLAIAVAVFFSRILATMRQFDGITI
ncbi:MAG TPA: DUF2628 domain-containing protein [Desulfuromonadales bacterium]|nr:DUF2628 domain-containing protein [Desulfuromonadales bacterium]